MLIIWHDRVNNMLIRKSSRTMVDTANARSARYIDNTCGLLALNNQSICFDDINNSDIVLSHDDITALTVPGREQYEYVDWYSTVDISTISAIDDKASTLQTQGRLVLNENHIDYYFVIDREGMLRVDDIESVCFIFKPVRRNTTIRYLLARVYLDR